MKHDKMQSMHWHLLLLMGAIHFLLMYALMYAMVDRFANVFMNLNQVYMAGIMTAPMLILEVALMGSMYANKRALAILAGASLLAEAGADVINVADSPMARMRMSPWAVCSVIQREFNIETVLHFPTRGRNLLRVQGDLLAAHALGIRNVFVVMGDPTEIGDYPDAMDDYDLVPSGLIKLIKEGFNVGVDHAGVEIGQPTSFFVGCALNLTAPDLDLEVKNLRRKIKAGADFILTQPVFQPFLVEPFLKRYTELSSPIEIPILVGVLPLFSPRHAAFLHNEVPGIEIPEEIHARLKKAGESAPQVGIRIATELIDQMRSWASGIYLMPAFNRYDLAAEVIEAVNK